MRMLVWAHVATKAGGANFDFGSRQRFVETEICTVHHLSLTDAILLEQQCTERMTV